MSVIHHHRAVVETSTHAASVASPSNAAARTLALVRIAFGLTFMWAFVDKLLALGYSTGRDPVTDHVSRLGDAAWIKGGSPTAGFLGHGAAGPFASFYESIAGAAWADTLFMLGLLGIGLALTLGVATRAACACGVVLYALMWSVVLPPASNPVLDDHVLGALTLVVLGLLAAGDTWGLGGWASRTTLVRRYPVLR